MVLALLLITVDGRIANANALKNMVIGVATVVSALLLAGLGDVQLARDAPLALGAFIGSTIGPLIARHIPAGPCSGGWLRSRGSGSR